MDLGGGGGRDGDKQSKGASSVLKFSYLLLEQEFHPRRRGEGGGGVSPAPEQRHTGLLNLTDHCDLGGFSKLEESADEKKCVQPT